MFDIELNSFIVKFHQLRSAGRYAHLDLHCEGGQSFVSLRVQRYTLGVRGMRSERNLIYLTVIMEEHK